MLRELKIRPNNFVNGGFVKHNQIREQKMFLLLFLVGSNRPKTTRINENFMAG